MLYVKSTGGAGTEFFKMRYRGQFADPVNPHTKDKLDEQDTLVYLYANPVDVLSSFARRGYLYPSVYQLQGDVKTLKSLDIPLTNVNGFDDLTIDDYLDNGLDLYKFKEHYEYFKAQPCSKLLVKYEGLKDALPVFERQLGLRAYREVKLRPRHESLNSEQKERIEELYKDWIKEYNELENIKFIK